MTKNQIIINITMLAVGAAIGSAVTWKIMKTRCDQKIREEVDAFTKEWPSYVGQRVKVNPVDDWNDFEDDDEDDEDDYDPDAIIDYHQIAKRYGSDETGEEGGGDDEVEYVNGPVVITPDEFNSMESGWTMYALTYYEGDGILADDWLVEKDIEETIGEEALECFGKYADEDVVHVRNEQTEAHYEVVRDPRNYADVLAGCNPHSHMNAY